MMNNYYEIIEKNRIIPLVSFSSIEQVIPTVKALQKGGFTVVEITFRTALGAKAIQIASERFPEVTVIAGTVLTKENVDNALDSGAKVLVSPGLNRSVVEYALNKKACIIPGIMTPSEIEIASEYNLTYLKLFPAEAVGGVKLVKALSGPYPNVKLMPTGGINSENVFNYLECKNVFACGGSWIANKRRVSEGLYSDILLDTQQLLAKVNSIKEK